MKYQRGNFLAKNIRLLSPVPIIFNFLFIDYLNFNYSICSFIADDCFELGRQCSKNDYFHHAVSWFQESLVKYEAETNKTVALEEILKHLSLSTYKRGTVNKLYTTFQLGSPNLCNFSYFCQFV